MTVDQEVCALAIVGTGTMGRGIAQIAVTAGLEVRLFDSRPGAAEEARAFVTAMLGRLVEKGKMPTETAAAANSRMRVAGSLADLAPADVVVEAIVEDLEIKRALFRNLENVFADTVLATNTSSLSVTAIAAGCRRPERIAGFHFFNPVPLIKLVEVIGGGLTDAAVLDLLVALARRIGHQPVRAADTPGFLVNHAGRGYGTEALRILGEGIAQPVDIDRILREAAGFRMGPFELLDLTALDVSHPAMESIYEQYYHEPRYRPSPITRVRLAAGLVGKKVGRGFYAYIDGHQVVPEGAPAPASRPASVWIGDSDAASRVALATLVRAAKVTLEDAPRPSAAALCLVAPLGEDATAAALAQGLDPTRTLAVDTFLGLDRRRTLMTTPVTAPVLIAAAHGLLADDGTAVTIIHDSPGFVAQRVLAGIVNIACDIAQQRIATPADIDRAVTLGLGYPQGPLAWGDALGPGRVLTILETLQRLYGDPRYRPSPWLRRRAALGVSLLTPEN